MEASGSNYRQLSFKEQYIQAVSWKEELLIDLEPIGGRLDVTRRRSRFLDVGIARFEDSKHTVVLQRICEKQSDWPNAMSTCLCFLYKISERPSSAPTRKNRTSRLPLRFCGWLRNSTFVGGSEGVKASIKYAYKVVLARITKIPQSIRTAHCFTSLTSRTRRIAVYLGDQYA